MNKIDLSKMNYNDSAEGVFMVESLEEKQTKDGKPYILLQICDGNIRKSAKYWDAQLDKLTSDGIQTGSVISGNITCQKYLGSKSFVLKSYSSDNGGYDPEEFIMKVPGDVNKMYEVILKYVCYPVLSTDEINQLRKGELASEILEKRTKDTLCGLTKNILEENKDKLLYWSAAEKMHHSMYGGLIYHMYRMVQEAYLTTKIYTNLDAEVLLCATALHDIGKLIELDTNNVGVAKYTPDGSLLGHLYLGLKIIDEEAAKGNYDTEKLRCLKHCIASHHGNQEWGALTRPATMEAMALFTIDYLDSHIESYEENTTNITPGTVSSEKDYMYETHLYLPNITK